MARRSADSRQLFSAQHIYEPSAAGYCVEINPTFVRRGDLAYYPRRLPIGGFTHYIQRFIRIPFRDDQYDAPFAGKI